MYFTSPVRTFLKFNASKWICAASGCCYLC